MLENRIYASYRSTLAALRKSSNSRNSRTAARKQDALRITADRYKVRISEVKAIIRTYEAIEGITHEHTITYLKVLEFNRQADALLAARPTNQANVCPNADNGEEHDDSVRVRLDTYLHEKEGEYVPLLTCFTCYLSDERFLQWRESQGRGLSRFQ